MHPSFSLQIEKDCYQGEALLKRANRAPITNTESWIESVFSFLRDWLNNAEEVTAKTSGSTGQPKLIHLKKESMLASAKLTCDYFGLQPLDKALLCLSADYIAGKMMLVRAIERGLHLIAVSPQGCPLSGIHEKVKFAAMVPLQVERCIEEGCIDKTEQLLIGGAALTNRLLNSVQKSTTACYISYGMTETMSHVALRRLNGSLASLLYEGLTGIRFSLDHRGCLFINTAPLGIESVQTNDLCELQDEQHFKWLGRADFVINSGGIKIIPEQIELLLSNEVSYPFIIAGIPHPLLGEQAVMIIEAESNDLLAAQLLKKANEVCPQYHSPKQILFVPQLTYTSSGKIDRAKTSKMFSS
ncbi:MAG: AMP-binding protein [Bacteroidetes bacterium]|nr:AMP-binding protein [Bacteroidota bacterium]